VKVVNTAPLPVETEISLGGVKKISGPGRAIVLTSDNPQDENTIDEPTKVSPKTEIFDVSSPDFRRTFPGNSFTVLRLKAEN
jgi:alpha-L-arabinofuranosidase